MGGRAGPRTGGRGPAVTPALLVLALGTGSPTALAEPRAIALRELFAAAAVHYPEVPVAASELRTAQAGRSLVRATRRWPGLTGTGVFGVVPAARGDIFDSPDNPRDLDDLGPFWRMRLEVEYPIVTWGALAEAERGAAALVGSREARTRAKRDAGLLLAARAYFGWQLATRSLAVATEVRGHLEAHLQRLESPPEGQETEATDLFRARHGRFELDRLEARARRRLREAEVGLRELAGEDARPVRDELLPLVPDTRVVEDAVAEALSANAEVQEAERAAQARGHVAEAVRRERLPAMALQGRIDYGHATNRDEQHNPFVYDPFNVRSVAATVGLRWDLSFKQRQAKVAAAAADAQAAAARARAVKTRVSVEVAGLHARVEEARAVHESSRRALSTTANWLRVAEENVGLGTASTKDLIDSYTAYAQARGAHFEAVHDLDLAVVEWRLALGRPPLAPEESP